MAFLGGINYIPVLVATLASFVLGWLWYGPLFGNLWLKLNGKNPKKMVSPKKGEMTRVMFLSFLGSLIMVYIFSFLISLIYVNGIFMVFNLAVLLWLGFFVCTTLLGDVLWDMKPWKLFFLNSAYWLVNLVLIGIILVSL
jgi:hypothetical protein